MMMMMMMRRRRRRRSWGYLGHGHRRGAKRGPAGTRVRTMPRRRQQARGRDSGPAEPERSDRVSVVTFNCQQASCAPAAVTQCHGESNPHVSPVVVARARLTSVHPAPATLCLSGVTKSTLRLDVRGLLLNPRDIHVSTRCRWSRACAEGILGLRDSRPSSLPALSTPSAAYRASGRNEDLLGSEEAVMLPAVPSRLDLRSLLCRVRARCLLADFSRSECKAKMHLTWQMVELRSRSDGLLCLVTQLETSDQGLPDFRLGRSCLERPRGRRRRGCWRRCTASLGSQSSSGFECHPVLQAAACPPPAADSSEDDAHAIETLMTEKRLEETDVPILALTHHERQAADTDVTRPVGTMIGHHLSSSRHVPRPLVHLPALASIHDAISHKSSRKGRPVWDVTRERRQARGRKGKGKSARSVSKKNQKEQQKHDEHEHEHEETEGGRIADM
eukprot:762142-Hanusia_phi.AAC.3